MHKGEIDIFIPCTIDQVFPEIGWDMVALLEYLNFKVNYNANQTCCGAPSFYNGLRDTTREIANKFLSDFSGNTKTVCPSTQCTVMVQSHYDQFFKNTSNHNIYRGLQSRLNEFTQFICKELEGKTPKGNLTKKVFYWGSCSGQNDCGIGNSAIEFLKKSGVNVVNENNLPLCCGNIGAVSALHEDISLAELDKSLEKILPSQPDLIIFDEPNCLLQVKGYFKKQNIQIETLHIAQVLKTLYVG